MMFGKFKFLICASVFGLIHFNSFAFDLQAAACKTVAGWTPLFGQCNEQGQLSGSGGALLGENLLIKGSFKAGLPDGKMEFFLGRQNKLIGNEFYFLKTSASADIRSWDSFVNEVSKKDSHNGQTLKSKVNFCEISFDAGQIANGDIECRTKVFEGELTYKIRPLAGKSYIRKGQIELDVPNVMVNLTNTRSMLLSDESRSLLITGIADELILSDTTTLHMRGLIGTVTHTPDPRSNLAKYGGDYAVSAQSYLDISCVGGNSNCYSSHMPFTPQGGNVNAKYLTKVTLKSGKTVQYVALTSKRLSIDALLGARGGTNLMPLNFPSMGNWNPSDNRFYYFKATNGGEFDGSASECNGKGSAATKGNDWKDFDFLPICGKVTMPDGRTYSGPFDREGKPLR